MENKFDELSHVSKLICTQRLKTTVTKRYPGADCDTDHQLLMASVKVRLAKRQRQHSIPPQNLEELEKENAVQFAAEVPNRFTALEAAHNEVTPEDLWKVLRQSCWKWPEKRLDPSNPRRKTNGYLMTFTQ